MAHTVTDILVCAAKNHIPETSLNARIRMYWCYEPSVQAAKRLLNRAIKSFRARKDGNNKQAMREAAKHTNQHAKTLTGTSGLLRSMIA